MLKFFTKAALVCAAIFSLVTARAEFTGFESINYWVGSGSNQAAMVIDWNDGTTTQSYVWGYRWDGDATGQDMFEAIVGSIIDTDDEPDLRRCRSGARARFTRSSVSATPCGLDRLPGGRPDAREERIWDLRRMATGPTVSLAETSSTTTYISDYNARTYDVRDRPNFASVNWFNFARSGFPTDR